MGSFMPKRNVLIVDDDPLIISILEKEIQRTFYQTHLASDGKTALEIFKNHDISIALVDVKLPDIDGFKLLESFKKDNPECEVIMVTGYGNQDIAITALRKGAIDYIEKPIDVNVLNAALGRAYERIRQEESLDYKNMILIIDDEQEVIGYLARYLKSEGYGVFSAVSGEEGLNIITTNKIDVVLTDINMKGMNGIDVVVNAKKLYSDIETIVMTGFKDTTMAVAALRAGASGYLTKPINLDELLLEINKATERINLNRNKLYRNRELKISSEIIMKMNEELERRIDERSKELSQTQSQLFQTSKLATLGEMSAGLAHEINQPLGGIALVAMNLRKLHERNRLDDEELLSGLRDIDASVKRMTKIIQHIRTFARQEALKFVEVEINGTIDSALSLLAEQLRLHQIEIELHLDPEGVRVAGEPYQLEQVWINLISNARDAVDEKYLQMKTNRTLPEGYKKTIKIATKYNEETGSAEVCFTDNGLGISDENIKRVLEPFFTTKEVGKSTGLGLSISYGIIENHKGSINIESQEGETTSVIITLPTDTKGEENG